MSHDLFIKPEGYGHKKEADVVLSRDGDSWEEEVSQNLHREHPYIQDKNINITITHKNPEQGAGVGAIKIDDKIMIPVIIDKFRMAPLDIFWKDSKLYPMSRDTVEEAIQDTALGTPVSPGRGESTDVSLYGRSQAPFDGKYTYASFRGLANVGDIKEALASAFDTEDGASYALMHNDRVIRSMARLVSGQEKEASASKSLKVTIKEPIDVRQVSESGPCKIASTTGPVNGLVVDYVIGLDGCPSLGRGMFIGFDKEGSYCHLDPGTKVAGSRVTPAGVSDSDGLKTRESGVFYKVGSHGAVCTEIITPQYRKGGDWVIEDGYGQRYTLHKVAGIKIPTKSGNRVLIPKSWGWRKTATKIQPMPADDGGEFKKKARTFIFNKVADDVDLFEVQQKLAAVYGSVEVDLITKEDSTPKPISGVNPVNLFKEATYIEPCAAFEIDLGAGPIKVGGVNDAEASETVDAILGLNFITPENTQRFIDKVPILEEARDNIAKLLLASRLGLNTDSRPLRTALYSLDNVIRDLNEIRHEVESYSSF